MSRTDVVQVSSWRELEYHDLCLAFPEMLDADFQDLRDNVVAWGVMEPITLFEGKILDGRHRHRAAVLENIEPRFETYMGPGSPVDYVLSKNLHRRNLNPAQRMEVGHKLIEWTKKVAAERMGAGLRQNQGKTTALANLPKRDEPNIVPFPAPEPVHVHAELAKVAGVSPRTAQDFLTVKEHGTAEDVRDVVSGAASVSGKAKEVRKREAVEATKPKQSEYLTLKAWAEMSETARKACLAVQGTRGFNRQDNEAIGWAKWSWNPITGCLHNCPYCYARDIANRFYEQGFEPSLIPERLSAPQNQRPRASEDVSDRNVFTGSMADMFGKWVPEEWIEAVMASVRRSPEWNFLFLTKFPRRMIDREVPKNVWLGTSVDMQARVKAVEDAFERVPAHTRWLSIEPLIEPLTFSRPELFNWVVIGGASASTKTPKWSPPFEWVADLYMQFKKAGVSVYIKDNIGFDGPRRPKEFPWESAGDMAAPPEMSYRGNQ
jgi:protein gp37